MRWKLWMEQWFPTLLPYYRYKDTKRHENLQLDYVCLIKYETKVASTYRLCRVSKLLPSDDGLVRSVDVRLGKKKHTKRNLLFSGSCCSSLWASCSPLLRA